jgi:hypothetical protein
MLRVFKIDKISSLEPENPDPLKLRLIAGIIVFFYTGIDASPATDTARKFKAIAPKGIREGFLCTDLKFLSVFSRVPFFQFGDQKFLLLLRHLPKMFLQKILGLLPCAGRQDRQGNPC